MYSLYEIHKCCFVDVKICVRVAIVGTGGNPRSPPCPLCRCMLLYGDALCGRVDPVVVERSSEGAISANHCARDAIMRDTWWYIFNALLDTHDPGGDCSDPKSKCVYRHPPFDNTQSPIVSLFITTDLAPPTAEISALFNLLLQNKCVVA